MNSNPNPKLFIAEDEQNLREMYAERFKIAGFKVTTFDNGLNLLTHLSEETPDAILLDINMPEMNGFDVLKSIHQNFSDTNKKSIPIIIWSNISNDSDIKRALDNGATVYLKKIDYVGDDLIEKVKEIMSATKS